MTVNRFLLVVLFMASASLSSAQEVGEKAKVSHVELFDGSKFDPKSVEGKPTLIYFWASWCPICVSEMPYLERHYQAYKNRGFKILAVNFRDDRADADRMLDRVKPITYPVGRLTPTGKPTILDYMERPLGL